MVKGILYFSIFFMSYLYFTMALPLFTDSRWIVDEKNNRVKLACISWTSHLQPVVAEGLSKQPIDVISRKIVAMGFNCVRLTWPTYLATNDTLANTYVRESLQSLGLNEAIVGFQENNPSMIDITLIQAFQEVVMSLTKNNVMVILDNHVSKPGWCCSNTDGNGFFGDEHFNSVHWITGLTNMASLFTNTPNVVGMSLRNELRGPRQNIKDWYKYMQQGAEAVHAANPNILVILSGLYFDKDLSFLRQRHVKLTFAKKTLFEMHRYSITDSSAWANDDPNDICGRILNDTMSRAGFLLKQGHPLFVSEWGVNQGGTNVKDNRFLDCFIDWFADFDLDWALWTLGGSYYVKNGIIGHEENFGVLNYNWNDIRNSSFLARISAIQAPSQGPGVSDAKLCEVLSTNVWIIALTIAQLLTTLFP